MPTPIKSPCIIGAIVLVCFMPFTVRAEDHRIRMLNKAADDAQQTNVFEPDILRVKIGDTVTFVPTDTGHNTASKRGMIPTGAQPWNSPMDEEFSITLTVPGVYGYICLPHYEMGMVGLIIVGDPAGNLEAAGKVRHPGAARSAFSSLLKEIRSGG